MQPSPEEGKATLENSFYGICIYRSNGNQKKGTNTRRKKTTGKCMMSVFRMPKRNNFTVMSNVHLRDASVSSLA